MMPSERRSLVLQEVQKRGKCGIGQLAELIDVSRVTIHRILDELEEQGLVRKERGGVRAAENPYSERRFEQRKEIDLELKREIGRKAVAYVGERDAIFVDASTTAYCFVEALAAKVPDWLLTVVTNSPAVAWRLLEVSAYHVIMTGGEVDHRLAALTGPLTLNTLEQLEFSKAFISPNAVSLKGIMTPHSTTSSVLSMVMGKNVETTLLAETPKFSRLAPLWIAPLSRLRRIVTDSRLPAETRATFEGAGVEIV